MTRLLFTIALLLALSVLGCGRDQTTAPKVQPSVASIHIGSPLSAVLSAGGVYERRTDHGDLYRFPNGTGVVLAKVPMPSVSARGVNLQRVDVGTITVVCWCVYPMNFIGPLPPGYGYVDGSGCN